MMRGFGTSDDPDAIRAEIEHTRARLAQTTAALAYKSDLPARAKDALGSAAASVASNEVVVRAAAVAKTTGKGAADRSRENPLGAIVAVLATGAFVGLIALRALRARASDDDAA